MNNRAGFSLLELLIVIGLIAAFAAFAGIGLKDSGRGGELRSAQAMITSMLSAAKSQAMTAQNRSRILVDADPASATFLRRLILVVESDRNTDRWNLHGTDIVLPANVFCVPASANLIGAVLPAQWPVTRLSSAVIDNAAVSITAPSGETLPGQFLRFVAIEPNGRLAIASSQATSGKVVLALALRQPEGIVFTDSNGVLGVSVSIYGRVTPIDDASGFDLQI